LRLIGVLVLSGHYRNVPALYQEQKRPRDPSGAELSFCNLCEKKGTKNNYAALSLLERAAIGMACMQLDMYAFRAALQ